MNPFSAELSSVDDRNIPLLDSYACIGAVMSKNSFHTGYVNGKAVQGRELQPWPQEKSYTSRFTKNYLVVRRSLTTPH